MKNTLNQNERLAIYFADEALRELVWAYELTLQDYPEGSEEHTDAKSFLMKPFFEIADIVAQYALELATKDAPNAKFAGKEFMETYIRTELMKAGYLK